ncbi:uncharacterized protein RJT21DRAFT_1274 [Scheffersomyces amazonensis]|uniref:uncharacterized protein n=1 Tax=Scheffersomyces amazonensis TaxID=1078765 RepID=UPI00315C826C
MSSEFPSVPEVHKQTPTQQIEEEYENLKKDVEGIAKDAYEEGKTEGEKIKKELRKFRKEAESYFAKLLDSLKRVGAQAQTSIQGVASKASKTSSTVFSQTVTELQNPVVIAQTVVGITGIAAGYAAYLERSRINTDNKLVLSLHASIITGLILLDGFLFTTYYPKYDKKKL